MDHNFERNLILAQATEDALEQTTGTLSEFFQHYALVVQYEDGSVLHVSDNALVEKALYSEALEIIEEEKEFEDSDIIDSDLEIDWDDDDEEDTFS
tara:strand:- start:8893 stop:9180 length:288 start_codon:yes stop_codon:yes gene_type:complete